ncbi:hypothetical protein LT493_01450 [Streptomyces tricolor]|nr:hypothetical protein [Streptomyces tricolor]
MPVFRQIFVTDGVSEGIALDRKAFCAAQARRARRPGSTPVLSTPDDRSTRAC